MEDDFTSKQQNVKTLNTVIADDENGNSTCLDVSQFVCSTGEMVNFESSVNIERSSDVIIGPVTNFNVQGNVTIVQNRKFSIHEKNQNIQDQRHSKGGKNIICVYILHLFLFIIRSQGHLKQHRRRQSCLANLNSGFSFM